MDLYTILNQLDISFSLVSHEPVKTIQEAQKIKSFILGVGCKNLFLTNHKGDYVLVVMEDFKRCNIKNIEKICKYSHLSFSSTQELWDILKLTQGSVSPFGIINDRENRVLIIIDEDLKNRQLLFHPNDNTKTLSLAFDDLLKFILKFQHNYLVCSF